MSRNHSPVIAAGIWFDFGLGLGCGLWVRVVIRARFELKVNVLFVNSSPVKAGL